MEPALSLKPWIKQKDEWESCWHFRKKRKYTVYCPIGEHFQPRKGWFLRSLIAFFQAGAVRQMLPSEWKVWKDQMLK